MYSIALFEPKCDLYFTLMINFLLSRKTANNKFFSMYLAPTTRSMLQKNKLHVGFLINVSFSLIFNSKLEALLSICDLHVEQTKTFFM